MLLVVHPSLSQAKPKEGREGREGRGGRGGEGRDIKSLSLTSNLSVY